MYVSLGISPLVTSRSCDEQSTGGGTPGWGVRTKDGWEQDEDISSSVGRSSACLSRRLRHSAPIFATTAREIQWMEDYVNAHPVLSRLPIQK